MKTVKYQRYLSLIVAMILGIGLCCPVQAKEPSEEGKAVLFLLDASGSMDTNDAEKMAVDSIAQMIYALPSDYQTGFAAYSEEVVANQAFAESSGRNEVVDAARKVKYKGYSNAGAGLTCAVEALAEAEAQEKYIVLLSDGEIFMRTEVETESSRVLYQSAIERAKNLGITIYVIGLGDGMAEMDNSIYEAADATGGKSYLAMESNDFQSIVDSILNKELGIQWSTVALVDSNGDLQQVVTDLPYVHADKLRVLLTSSAPIENLNANFQAESARQINGERYSLIEMVHPTEEKLELSFQGTRGTQIRVNVIPEYYVIPTAEVTYEDSVPAASTALYYDRTATVCYRFYSAEKQSIQLWDSTFFDHNKISIAANGETSELTLQAGTLETTEEVTEACEYEVTFDYSRFPVNVIEMESVSVSLEAPEELPPVEEPEPPYLLIGVCVAGGLLLIALILFIMWYLHRPKPMPLPAEERPEPSKYSYVGKLNLYITRTSSGYDIPPLSYNLFRLPSGRVVSLREILDECEVKEELPGADYIYFKAGPNRTLILTNNSDCTIMKNREILMKKKSYVLPLDSKVDVSFEDEISELAFQYKDLKSSEMW